MKQEDRMIEAAEKAVALRWKRVLEINELRERAVYPEQYPCLLYTSPSPRDS